MVGLAEACASVAAAAMFLWLSFLYLDGFGNVPTPGRAIGHSPKTLSPGDPGLPLATDNATHVEYVMGSDDDKPTETP